MYADEIKYPLISNNDDSEYLKERSTLVTQIFDISKRFVLREESIHLAIELLDRLFLDKLDEPIE